MSRHEEIGGDRALSAKTRHTRVVVDAAKQREGLTFGVFQAPDVIVWRAAAHDETAGQPHQPRDRRSHPLQESRAGGHDRDKQTRVHIFGLLEGVVSIDVGHDRTVSVDAAPHEISEPDVRNGDWAEPEALRWHEAEFEQPAVEYSIAPLQPVTRSSRRVRCAGDRISQAEATPHRLEHVQVFRSDTQVPAIDRQAAVGRYQPYDPRKVGRPCPRCSRPRQARSARASRDAEPSESAQDRDRAATDASRDLVGRQPLVDVELLEELPVDRHERGMHSSALSRSPRPSMSNLSDSDLGRVIGTATRRFRSPSDRIKREVTTDG